jgi:hypothetical protein
MLSAVEVLRTAEEVRRLAEIRRGTTRLCSRVFGEECRLPTVRHLGG